MAWRQGQSYSEDLRARVLVAVGGDDAVDALSTGRDDQYPEIWQAGIQQSFLCKVIIASYEPDKPTPVHHSAGKLPCRPAAGSRG